MNHCMNAVALACIAGLAGAEDIPLEYNWNGLAHAGEVFKADTPQGYRSIQDRGILTGTADSLGGLTGSVTGLGGTYQLVMDPDTPDVIFVGTREAGWDNAVDADALGNRPSWDPTGNTGYLESATTTVGVPILMTADSVISFLHTSSNQGVTSGGAGGYIYVSLNFTDSTQLVLGCQSFDWSVDFNAEVDEAFMRPEIAFVHKLSGPLADGLGFAGLASVDRATPGTPISVYEVGASRDTILKRYGTDIAGKMLETIEFIGVGINQFHEPEIEEFEASAMILGLCVNGQNVPLDCNWNGTGQPSEINSPDINDPDGYRSIGDRGLTVEDADSIGGGDGEIVTDNMTYHIEMNAGVVDTIMIGTRSRPWDDVADADELGVAPAWNHSGGSGVINQWRSRIDSAPNPWRSRTGLGLLYNASEGGGHFNVTLDFLDSTSVTVTLHAPDWYANGDHTVNAPLPGVASQTVLEGPLSNGDGFAATSSVDLSVRGGPLNLTEAVISTESLWIDLGFDARGKSLLGITFDSGLTAPQAAGIYAASLTELGGACRVDVNDDRHVDFFDLLMFLNWYSNADLNADFTDDGVLDFFDLQAFLNLYSEGCP